MFEITKTPWDVLVKNMFNDIDTFNSLSTKIAQPTDVYEDESGLHIEVACVGANKEDINVECQEDTLRISYNKKEEDKKTYLYRGIRRGNFDFSWKIARRFDLSQITVVLEKGILSVHIPIKAEKESQVRTIEIQ